MPCHLGWYQENRVTLIQVWGSLSFAEIQALDEQYIQLVQSVNQPIYSLVDASKIEKIPLDIKLMNNTIQSFKEPNIECVIIVLTNLFIAILASTLSRLARRPFRIVATWEEALTVLEELDVYFAISR